MNSGNFGLPATQFAFGDLGRASSAFAPNIRRMIGVAREKGNAPGSPNSSMPPNVAGVQLKVPQSFDRSTWRYVLY